MFGVKTETGDRRPEEATKDILPPVSCLLSPFLRVPFLRVPIIHYSFISFILLFISPFSPLKFRLSNYLIIKCLRGAKIIHLRSKNYTLTQILLHTCVDFAAHVRRFYSAFRARYTFSSKSALS